MNVHLQDKSGETTDIDLSVLLSKAEMEELLRLKTAGDVVSVEIMGKDGTPIHSLTAESLSLSAIFSNVLDLAVLAGAEVGEATSDTIVIARTKTYDVTCFRLSKVDAVVARTRETRTLSTRMRHVR